MDLLGLGFLFLLFTNIVLDLKHLQPCYQVSTQFHSHVSSIISMEKFLCTRNNASGSLSRFARPFKLVLYDVGMTSGTQDLIHEKGKFPHLLTKQGVHPGQINAVCTIFGLVLP